MAGRTQLGCELKKGTSRLPMGQCGHPLGDNVRPFGLLKALSFCIIQRAAPCLEQANADAGRVQRSRLELTVRQKRAMEKNKPKTTQHTSCHSHLEGWMVMPQHLAGRCSSVTEQ